MPVNNNGQSQQEKDAESVSPKKASAVKSQGNDPHVVPDVDENYQIPNRLFKFIPQGSAELYKIVPLKKEEDTLYVGAVDPNNLDARDALNFITTGQDLQYEMQKIEEDLFQVLLKQYDGADFSMDETLEQLVEEGEESVLLGIDEEEDDLRQSGDVIREEAPVIKLVSTILAQAVSKGVSDVHVEPNEKSAVVRYRLDGILQNQMQFSRKILDSFVARIKILANLRIDERRRPQDGRFSSRIKDSRVDFRVAIFPTVNGEKVILRVLDKDKGLRDLASIGLEEGSYESILRAIKRPYGLVLATGPTGAGKTTTLYAILSMSDRVNQSIVSLEDPVEYRLEGVNQSNIRPEIGYSFATGLRSVLRADPDQILVGEIRDKETATLAVQAALTGHLVYSTLHTNSAIGAVSRLLNFGIDPFLLAPTLSLVIGQRMLRRLDGEGKEVPVNAGMKKHLEEKFADLPQRYRSKIPDFASFRDPVPSERSPSGMRGRVGVFEVFEVDEEIRSIIYNDPSEAKMYEAARKNGFMTMGEDAIVKGLRGIVPLSEAVKVGNEGVLDVEGEETAAEGDQQAREQQQVSQ